MARPILPPSEARRLTSSHRRASNLERRVAPGGPSVSDGSTTVDDVTLIVVTGATVADGGGGEADITIAAAPAQFDIKVFGDTTVIVTGDGAFIFAIPADLNGATLSSVAAYVTTVSSSGAPNVQIRNVSTSNDMLSTPITIDATEFTSYTAATPAVIDGAHDTVSTGDRIAVDVDTAGTGAKGLGVILEFTV